MLGHGLVVAPGVQSDDQWLVDSMNSWASSGSNTLEPGSPRRVWGAGPAEPARLTFIGRSHNTRAQPHPMALAQGSVGFASDPRIPPGPSVTIGASHMKAPSHPHLNLLPRAHWSPPRCPFPEGGVSWDRASSQSPSH